MLAAPLALRDWNLANVAAGVFVVACMNLAQTGARTRGAQLSESVEQLDGDGYARSRTLLRWFSPVLFFACACALWALLVALRWLTTAHLRSGADVLVCGHLFWVLPSLMLARPLSLTAEVHALRFFGISPERYHKTHARVAQEDVWRETWYDGFALIGGWLLVYFALNFVVVFGPSSITVRQTYDKADQRYAYSDVSAIYRTRRFRAPSGRIVERTRYVLEFANGSRWCNEDGMRQPVLADDTRVIERVSQRAGRPIVDVDMLCGGL